jgi:hypothetical protein
MNRIWNGKLIRAEDDSAEDAASDSAEDADNAEHDMFWSSLHSRQSLHGTVAVSPGHAWPAHHRISETTKGIKKAARRDKYPVLPTSYVLWQCFYAPDSGSLLLGAANHCCVIA